METIERIAQSGNLTQACWDVVRNKGAGGVDKMPVKQLKAYLDKHRIDLQSKLLQGTYLPQPVRGKEIPKGKKKTRLLGIPTAVDRMLQQAVVRVVATQYELEFSNYSYGYRPKKNAGQAITKALEYINNGYQDIVEMDLKAFFDEVDHVLLLELIHRKIKCPKTMLLIKRWLRAPMLVDGKLQKRRKGVPQGSPISPLFSNIMLHELDKYLESENIRFVRYADDFSIYCSSKSEAKMVGNKVYLFLRDKLRLKINREKSGIRRPINLQVLGFGFVPTYRKGERGQYQLVVGKERWKRLQKKLKYATRKTRPLSLDERIKEIQQIQRGWMNYFKYGNIKNKVQRLDGWLRNRLRYCIWHDWKKPNKKKRSLIQLGIEPGMAYAWSRTRMGGWAVAQSPILGTTITKERLKKKGFVPLSEYYEKYSKHSFNNSLFPMI